MFGKNEIRELAQRVIDEVKRIAAATTAELETLDNNEDLRDEVKLSRKQEILNGYKQQLSAFRKDAGKDIDDYLNEIRRFAQTINPPAPNPANAAMLQMLTLAPTITQPMLIRAAESIGDDQTAADILQQIAAENGYHTTLTGILKPPTKHLRKADIEEVADSLQSSFMRFFDARSNYDDEDPTKAPTYTDQRERVLNLCERTQTAAELADIAGGSAFSFGGDAGLQAEFDLAAES